MMWYKNIIILFSAVLLFSCSGRNDSPHYSFSVVNSDGWAYGDTLFFDAFCDSVPSYSQLAIAVRHSEAYKYANLWLEVTVPVAGQDSLIRDTVNVLLADRYGEFLGRGSGVSYIVVDTLPQAFSLRTGSPISLRHVMRVDTLHDIEQIGVMIL